MTRSTERSRLETAAAIAATNGREPGGPPGSPAAVPLAAGPAAALPGSAPNAWGVRVTLAPEHDATAAVTVGADGTTIDGATAPMHLRWVTNDRARLEPAGVDVLFLEAPDTGHSAPGVVRREVVLEGWRVVVEIEPAARAQLRERASRSQGAAAGGTASELHAMIPGRVLSIGVAVGDAVEAGQAVMIIEAMKMQNELRVPRAGVVSRIVVAPGGTVERGDLLIALEPAAAPTPGDPS
jgi:biotin carboxyl carrier protein